MLLLVLLISCSSDHDSFLDPASEIKKELTFSLKADATKRNLLQMTALSIGFKEDVTTADIRKYYDQLEWAVKDNMGEVATYSLMSENHFTFSWGHCFHYPGTFVSSLVGRKEGKIVFESNPVTIQISADKDFLGWNWDELPDNTDSGKGYVNVLEPDMELSSLTVNEKDKHGIYVYLFNAIGQEEFYKTSAEKLYNYMVKLYGKPAFVSTDKDLNKVYRAEFAYQLPNSIPLAVWKTAKSRMVLLEIQREIKSARIFAEPIR